MRLRAKMKGINPLLRCEYCGWTAKASDFNKPGSYVILPHLCPDCGKPYKITAEADG